MEDEEQLKDLNITMDDLARLSNAMKNDEFRKMFRDYANELSDPENKKRYEDEIKLLEKERGISLDFIHPEPFRALRTSVNGKQKCYINICANHTVGKPECKWGVSEDGRRGQSWSLPHSLHPGRRDTDPKGNKIVIYDVVFHPDTLHIASKNAIFMDMLVSTAIQGIQDTFSVTLDKNNIREMSTKYKGTPQPCVTRKPIPGFIPKEPFLAFPYPDGKSLLSKPTESPSSEAKSFSVQPQTAKEPTKPNYTVKYRSFMDLQDFRCSRDSAQSPRPKQIVVTIDMPLLKAATDASLEVNERQLLLESQKPAYRLGLPLAYPVDEDKGEARFNKQRGQLTVTLHVLPSDEAFGLAVGLAQTDERQEEKSELEEDKWKEKESKKTEDLGQQTRAEEEETGVEEEAKWKEQERKGLEEEKLKDQENEKEDGNIQKPEDKRDSGETRVQCDAEEENSSPETENQPVVEHSSCTEKEEEVNLGLDSTPTVTPDHKEETGESVHGNKVETDAASLHHGSREESQTPVAPHSQNNMEDGCVPQECSETPATDEANGSSNGVALQDDLPTEQIFHKPPPAILREIDRDGNEKIISDHSTSAGIIFQNSLMFELD